MQTEEEKYRNRIFFGCILLVIILFSRCVVHAADDFPVPNMNKHKGYAIELSNAREMLGYSIRRKDATEAKKWAVVLANLEAMERTKGKQVIPIITRRDIDAVTSAVSIEISAYQRQLKLEPDIKKWIAETEKKSVEADLDKARALYRRGEELHWSMDPTRMDAKLLTSYTDRMKILSLIIVDGEQKEAKDKAPPSDK